MGQRPKYDGFDVQQDHALGVSKALKMIDVFASVGVQAFDITHTNIDEEKRGFRRKQSLDQARRSMPYLLDSAPRRQNNVIIRPHQPRRVSHSALRTGKGGMCLSVSRDSGAGNCPMCSSSNTIWGACDCSGCRARRPPSPLRAVIVFPAPLDLFTCVQPFRLAL